MRNRAGQIEPRSSRPLYSTYRFGRLAMTWQSYSSSWQLEQGRRNTTSQRTFRRLQSRQALVARGLRLTFLRTFLDSSPSNGELILIVMLAKDAGKSGPNGVKSIRGLECRWGYPESFNDISFSAGFPPFFICWGNPFPASVVQKSQ
jgi:hypothetical protein